MWWHFNSKKKINKYKRVRIEVERVHCPKLSTREEFGTPFVVLMEQGRKNSFQMLHKPDRSVSAPKLSLSNFSST